MYSVNLTICIERFIPHFESWIAFSVNPVPLNAKLCYRLQPYKLYEIYLLLIISRDIYYKPFVALCSYHQIQMTSQIYSPTYETPAFAFGQVIAVKAKLCVGEINNKYENEKKVGKWVDY